MLSRLFTSRKIFVCLLAMGATALLGACGGGGGGELTFPNLNYTGISTSAATTIDTSNADEFPFAILEGSSGSDNLPLAFSTDLETPVQIPDPDNIKTSMSRITEIIKNKFDTSDSQVTGVTQIDTGQCGGKFTYTENVSSNSFNGSLIFDQYCEGDLDTLAYEFKLHGKITFSGTYTLVANSPVFDTLNFNIQYMKMSFYDGTNTVSEVFSGSVVVTSFDAGNNPVDFTMSVNFVYQGQVFKIKNLVVDDSAGTKISGTLYHPDFGYVEITTPVAFTYFQNDPFDDTDDQFCNGGLLLTADDGAGNTAAIAFIDNASNCSFYDICININGTEQCSFDNPWGVAPVWPPATPTTPAPTPTP